MINSLSGIEGKYCYFLLDYEEVEDGFKVDSFEMLYGVAEDHVFCYSSFNSQPEVRHLLDKFPDIELIKFAAAEHYRAEGHYPCTIGISKCGEKYGMIMTGMGPWRLTDETSN